MTQQLLIVNDTTRHLRLVAKVNPLVFLVFRLSQRDAAAPWATHGCAMVSARKPSLLPGKDRGVCHEGSKGKG